MEADGAASVSIRLSVCYPLSTVDHHPNHPPHPLPDPPPLRKRITGNPQHRFRVLTTAQQRPRLSLVNRNLLVDHEVRELHALAAHAERREAVARAARPKDEWREFGVEIGGVRVGVGFDVGEGEGGEEGGGEGVGEESGLAGHIENDV